MEKEREKWSFLVGPISEAEFNDYTAIQSGEREKKRKDF